MRISDWSSDVCSSDLRRIGFEHPAQCFADHAWRRKRRGVAGRQRAAVAVRTAAADRALFEHTHLPPGRSEEHTSELQSLMRISYAVFCLKKKRVTAVKTKIYKNTHEYRSEVK